MEQSSRPLRACGMAGAGVAAHANVLPQTTRPRAPANSSHAVTTNFDLDPTGLLSIEQPPSIASYQPGCPGSSPSLSCSCPAGASLPPPSPCAWPPGALAGLPSSCFNAACGEGGRGSVCDAAVAAGCCSLLVVLSFSTSDVTG